MIVRQATLWVSDNLVEMARVTTPTGDAARADS